MEVDALASLFVMVSNIHSRRSRALETVTSYTERTLRRALGWGDAPLEIEVPKRGSTSLVYLIRPEGKPGAALYAIKDRRELRMLESALRTATSCGAPVPKLLHADANWITRFSRGYFFLACSLAPGECMRRDESDDAQLKAMATALAKLHSIEENYWGKPIKPRRSGIHADWSEGIERLRSALMRDAAMKDHATEIRDYFHRSLEKMEEPKRFQLCHHHLAPVDMLYDASSQSVTLIDCVNLEFSRAARDLASVRWDCFPNDEKSFDAMLKHYYSQISPAIREGYERERYFFEGFFHLRKVYNHSRGKDRKPSPALTRLMELIHREDNRV